MSEKKYQKKKVEFQVFYKQKEDQFTWSDLKDIKFDDDDIIKVEWVEPYYSENNSWDGHYNAEVIRFVEETDEQFEKRIERIEIQNERSRKERYERYLQLKAEFEGD